MRDPFRAICDDDLERRWIWISLILAFVMGGLLGLHTMPCIIRRRAREVKAVADASFKSYVLMNLRPAMRSQVCICGQRETYGRCSLRIA